MRVRSARVDEDYFDTLNIPIRAGRAIRESDTGDTPHVAVVNETFASRYWRGQQAIGKRFRLVGSGGGGSANTAETTEPWIEIIGIAADTRYRSVAEGPTEYIYYARRQRTWFRKQEAARRFDSEPPIEEALTLAASA